MQTDNVFVKSNITFLVALVVASFFSGCKKDPAASYATTTTKVKSAVLSSPGGISYTYLYTYDSSGRQVQLQADTTVTTYVFAPGSITKNVALAGHNFVTTYATNSWGGVTSDSKGFVYSYDNNNYLTVLSYTAAGKYDSTVYTVMGGNVTSAVQHQVDSTTDNLVTTVYTYSTKTDTRDYGAAFFGKQNTNLLTAEAITQVLNGTTIVANYTYTYAYDAQGRISQQIQTGGSASYTTTYTYY